MFADLRHAARSLAKSPGYTAIALLTLALGIGVNTSMFSVLGALLFRHAPYPDPERLIQIATTSRQGEMRTFSDAELREIRAQADAFSSLTTLGYPSYAMAEGGRPAERIQGISLSSGMLDTFRTAPLLGRMFTLEEFEPGKNQAVLLSEQFWRARFGGDPGIVGRTLRLDGEAVTIVGVMPARFDYKMFWGNVALWRPLNFTADQSNIRAYRAFGLIGRLKPGRSVAAAATQLTPLAARQEKEFPADYPGLRYRVLPLHAAQADATGRGLSWLLVGLSGCVLLIACANLANLQLARTTASLREFAVRAALGASHGRLIRQQLTECVVLSLAGGALGVVLALWLNSLLERTVLIDGATGFEAALDFRVLALAFGVALASGLVFGLAPALLAARIDVNAMLKQQSRGATASRSQHRLRQALIVGEVALALMLLCGAMLMNRGFDRFLHRPTGWDTARVLTAAIALPENRFDIGAKRIELYQKVTDRVAALPGVEGVALASSLPLFNHTSDRQVFVDAPSAGAMAGNPVASHVIVTPRYFETMGVPVLAGRGFSAAIKPGDPEVILVNQALAQRFWPEGNAVGKRLGVVENNRTELREIIGVVGDVQSAANFTEGETRFQVYRPLVQEPWSAVFLAVRSEQPAALAEAVRRAVAEVDADLPADQIATVRQFIDRTQHNLVLFGRILAGFAVLGLVLAALGLYGVISNLVAQRTSEFGIRLALGAQAYDVLGDMLGRGLRLAALGFVVGGLGTIGLGRVLASILPRIATPDPVGFAMVSAFLFLVALAACWLPARRAMRVNPIVALRSE